MTVNLFSTKVLIGETIFTSSTGNGTAAAVIVRTMQSPSLHFYLIYDPEYWSGTGNNPLCSSDRQTLYRLS